MNLDELIVLTHEGQSEADGSVAKLAEWMGLRTLMLPSSLKRGEDDVLLGLLPSRGAGLAISADTLAHLLALMVIVKLGYGSLRKKAFAAWCMVSN